MQSRYNFAMNVKSKYFSALLCSSILSVVATQANDEVRILNFANAYPTGKLEVVTKAELGAVVLSKHIAQGKVSMTVPPGAILRLELNPHCIENSERLRNMPTNGIDCLQVAYMSMDEGDKVCDRAMAALPVFPNALRLLCFRTDLTDAGLTSFKSLDKVYRLECFMSFLDGSFFNEYKRLQNLRWLNVSHNSLKSSNLKNISQLKDLEQLDLLETTLTDEGLREVGKLRKLKKLVLDSNARISDDGLQSLSQCSMLEEFSVAFDKKITDKSIPTLQKFIHLKRLDLSHTHITPAGVQSLKNLKLEWIVLPESLKLGAMVKLQKYFPKTKFRLTQHEVSEDAKIQLAPMK